MSSFARWNLTSAPHSPRQVVPSVFTKCPSLGLFPVAPSGAMAELHSSGAGLLSLISQSLKYRCNTNLYSTLLMKLFDFRLDTASLCPNRLQNLFSLLLKSPFPANIQLLLFFFISYSSHIKQGAAFPGPILPQKAFPPTSDLKTTRKPKAGMKLIICHS